MQIGFKKQIALLAVLVHEWNVSSQRAYESTTTRSCLLSSLNVRVYSLPLTCSPVSVCICCGKNPYQVHLTFDILINCRQPKKLWTEAFSSPPLETLTITCSGNKGILPALYKMQCWFSLCFPCLPSLQPDRRLQWSSRSLLGQLASTTRVYLTLLWSLSSSRALASRCLVHLVCLTFLPSGRGQQQIAVFWPVHV